MTLPKTTKDLKIGSNSIIVQSILLFWQCFWQLS